MTAPRSRKQVKQYNRHQKNFLPSGGNCVFCQIDHLNTQFIEESKHFSVIKNLFPYTLWDGQAVKDHLLIIPKQHTDTLADLSPLEAQEYLKLVGNYEQKGYSIFARAPSSIIKTVVHQHTHLIKHSRKRTKFIFYISKPYIRFSF